MSASERAPTPRPRELPRGDGPARVLQLDDVLDPLSLKRPQQPGGDDDVLAILQLPLDPAHDGRVLLRGLCQEDGWRVSGEVGDEIHRDADHAEIACEEVFAGGVVRLVHLHADRRPELADEAIHLLKHVPGQACQLRFWRHAPVILPDRLVQLPDVEERDLRRLREEREPELLGVTVEVSEPARVHPSAPVSAWLDVLEVSEDRIAVVLLQVLVAVHRVARLGPGVDPVEVLRLGLEVESQVLEVVIPVRVLDDDLHVRIDRPCRLHHQGSPGFVHLLEPEGRPAPAAFRADAEVALAAREEEVVEDDLVEVPRRELDDLLQSPAVLGI